MAGLNRKNKNSGSITVFFSLIMLLILSFLLTIIEGARLSTAKVFAERSMTTAMDSVLAEYYGPLWEEYHIFGLDQNSAGQDISAELKEYMSYTFLPNTGINSDTTEFYDISADTVSVTDKTMLTDYQGELFINQAVEYMKYKEAGNAAEQLFDKMSLLSQPKKISYLYEEKQKVEDELVEIDEGILDLMMYLDGVKTGKKGLSIAKDGSLNTVSGFVKKINFGSITKESAGINQESIFLALKDHYINPLPYFVNIGEDISSLNNIQQNISWTGEELAGLQADISEAEAELEELNGIKEKSKETKAEIKEKKENIKELKDQTELLQKKIEQFETDKSPYINDLNSNKDDIRALIVEIWPCIDNALNTIDNIQAKIDTAGPLISGYENSLSSAKNEISEGIFEGLEEDLTDLKRYVQTDGRGYDFQGMKQTLKHDQLVLTQVESLLDSGSQKLSAGDYQSAGQSFQNAGEFLKDYQTENLKLDYSTIVLDKKAPDNPLDIAGSFLEDGIVSLVTDSSEISDLKLPEEALPSEIAAMAGEDGDFLSQLTGFFKNAVIGIKNSGMSGLFESFGNGTGDLSSIKAGLNTAAEIFLFQEYLREHFYSFPTEKESLNTRKPSILSYEQEYLLAGKKTDKDNLSSIITRIIFLRTVFDFVSILGDKDKCSEARAAASALVGFTGLPILVSITKTLILLAWAFEEALVDTSALLMGKEVPVLKKNLILTFPELFLISNTYIQKKAQEIKDTKEISLSYKDYLRAFLLLVGRKDLAYRSMDLIQENIRIRYLDDFSMQNCIFGFKVSSRFQTSSKFTGFTFVKRLLGNNREGFQFTINSACSY